MNKLKKKSVLKMGKGPAQFSKEDTQMANGYMRRCSADHQGNANRNAKELSPPPDPLPTHGRPAVGLHRLSFLAPTKPFRFVYGCYQQDKRSQVSARMWRKGDPCALLTGL